MTLATKFMSDKRWRVELSPFESGDGRDIGNNIESARNSICCYLCYYCSRLFIA